MTGLGKGPGFPDRVGLNFCNFEFLRVDPVSGLNFKSGPGSGFNFSSGRKNPGFENPGRKFPARCQALAGGRSGIL